jgi:hypothetical protein
MLFTHNRVSLCFLNVRRSWTLSRLLNREMHYHCAITEPTAMCWLCCWIKFCSTQYNTPRTFCLASYSVVFCDQCNNVSQRIPPTTQTAYEPLGATLRTNTLPFLIPTDWLVSYGSQHHLLLFTAPCSLRHVEQCSSPYISFAVTTTGLISDRCLATVSRLA